LKIDFNSLLLTLKRCSGRKSGNSNDMFEQLGPLIEQAIEADASIPKDKTGNFDITLQILGVVRKILRYTSLINVILMQLQKLSLKAKLLRPWRFY
jgi:hypothetical protein